MTKIFIGGSRHAGHLNSLIREKLDDIVGKKCPIMVGDANGADRAFQDYLHEKHYRHVEVFCTEGACRNNIGNWTRRDIPAGTSRRDSQFHSAKDRVMAQEATSGLMMWDGKSVGTLLNLYRLVKLNKKASVYSIPESMFLEFQDNSAWESFLQSRDIGLQKRVERRRNMEPGKFNNQMQMSFVD